MSPAASPRCQHFSSCLAQIVQPSTVRAVVSKLTIAMFLSSQNSEVLAKLKSGAENETSLYQSSARYDSSDISN